MPQLKIKNNGTWVDIPAGGVGVPSGGTTGQVLQKSSNTDYATEWNDLPTYGQVYNDYHSGDVTVAKDTTSDLGISLTLPSGSYIVIIHCSFYKSGSGSGSSYLKVELSVDGVTQTTGRSQGGSTGTANQIVCSSTFVVNIPSTSVVKPAVSATNQPAVVFDTQSIDAIRIA